MSFINKELYENADSQRKATQITWEIADCLHQVGAPTYNAFPLIPYLLHKVSLYNNPFGITLQAIVDGEIEVNDDVRYLAKDILNDKLWERLLQMVTKYSPEEFALAAVNPVIDNEPKGTMTTPNSILKLAHKLLDALRTVAEMLADQLANRSGGQYLLFFLLLGVTLVCLIVDARAGRPVFWKGCAAVTAVIVFLALLLMYRPVEGSRHTVVLDVLLLAALLVEDARPAAGTAAAALVLAALGVLNLADGFTMPRYSAEWDAAVQQIEAALTESRSAVTSADPWDSTVAYAFGDPVHCGLLYGVPDGMGIQFDEAAYLTDPAHEIHSRYVLTAADTPTAARLQADGWTVLYESDRGVLYER